MTHADLLALCLLFTVLAAIIGWLATGLFRRPYGLVGWMVFFASMFLTRVLWRCTVSGPLPVKCGQGAVVVCNHRSSVDPFFVQLAAGTRRIHWMVAREFVEHPAFRWFLGLAQVIPAGRGGIDIAATKQAIRLAADGGIVGMLPEGRINRSEEMLLPVRPGAALVALRAHVPIIPCYIDGAPYNKLPYSPLFMPARVHVSVGLSTDLSPFYGQANDHHVLRRLTLRMMTAVARLGKDSHFQPRLAGRNWKPTPAELEMDSVPPRRTGK